MTGKLKMRSTSEVVLMVRSRYSNPYAAPADSNNPTNPAKPMISSLLVPSDFVGRFAGSTTVKVFNAPCWELERNVA